MTALAAGDQRAALAARRPAASEPSRHEWTMATRLVEVLLVLVAFGMLTGYLIGTGLARGVHLLLG